MSLENYMKRKKLTRKELKLISKLLSLAYFKFRELPDDFISPDIFEIWEDKEVTQLIQGISALYDDKSLLSKPINKFTNHKLMNFFSHKIDCWLGNDNF